MSVDKLANKIKILLLVTYSLNSFVCAQNKYNIEKHCVSIVMKPSVMDSTGTTIYADDIYKFKPERVIIEIAGGTAMGFIGMIGGGFLGKMLAFNQHGEFAGFAETLTGMYAGYLIGSTWGVYIVSKGYTDEATFWTPLLASFGGAALGWLNYDSKGWQATLPLVMPILSCVFTAEILYPSKVKVNIENKELFPGDKKTSSAVFTVSIPLN